MFSGTSNKVTVGLELVASQLSSNIIQLCSCWPVCYKEPQTAVMVLREFRALDLKIHYLMCQYGIVHQHTHLQCLLQGEFRKRQAGRCTRREGLAFSVASLSAVSCCKMDATLTDLYYLNVLEKSLVCH